MVLGLTTTPININVHQRIGEYGDTDSQRCTAVTPSIRQAAQAVRYDFCEARTLAWRWKVRADAKASDMPGSATRRTTHAH
jgi:hypothetical protein